MFLIPKMARQAHHHIEKKGLFFLLIIALFGLVANASVIIVYEDNFDGNGVVNLHGLAPDVDNNGGGHTWIAYSGWKADGTRSLQLSNAALYACVRQGLSIVGRV